jgi:hypothetical protein
MCDRATATAGRSSGIGVQGANCQLGVWCIWCAAGMHMWSRAHQQKGQPNERAKATTAFSSGPHRLEMSTSAASLERMTCAAADRLMQ